MRKLEKRALFCLLFSLILVVGSFVYVYKFASEGSQWIAYPANEHLYTKGRLATGTIEDRNGTVLVSNDKDGNIVYNSDLNLRTAMLHVTGDIHANISTGANRAFKDKLIGYNLITGTFSASGEGRKLSLTVDSDVSKAAKEALGNRTGTVAVFNYKTGEILCMVSSPNYDPAKPPVLDKNDTSGAYINRATSAAIVPGSIFKLVTSSAAIDNLPNLNNWTYTCTGVHTYGNSEKDRVTCLKPHGKQTFKEALANSCNCAYGELSNDIGEDKLKETIKQSGLTDSYDIDGIKTTPSSIETSSQPLNLAWTGIGQNKDLVNPISMLVYVGAIAGEGEVHMPYIIKDISSSSKISLPYKHTDDTKKLLESSTAKKIQDMMRNNVQKSYGDNRFPNLEVYGKTGTAEHKKGDASHAWFTGFIKDENHPYAFIVLVEKGGYGVDVATTVANKVLQVAIKK